MSLVTNDSLVKGCGFCSSKDLKTVIDFGKVGLAGGFLKPLDFPKEQTFPMHLAFCEACLLLQVSEHVPPSKIFGDGYFYYSSNIQTLKDHFQKYAREVIPLLNELETDLVVEVGCNDGVLLDPLLNYGCRKLVGIDPSTNVLEKISNPVVNLINDFFSLETSKSISEKFGHAKLILANNVFAHISDIRDFVSGIEHLLADDGVFVFEVHYIRNLIEGRQYDMIYHEHLYNYSLLTLQKFFNTFKLEVFNVKEIPIHAGSMRYYVKRISDKRNRIGNSVAHYTAQELQFGYDKYQTFLEYAKQVEESRSVLVSILNHLKNDLSSTIVGYGASGRANTVLQYCNLSSQVLDYIVDDAPSKQGFFTPRTHIEIKSREFLKQDQPDYILCFAWSFMDEIANKNGEYLENGGVFIVPLPEPYFLSLNNKGELTKRTSTQFLESLKEPDANTSIGKRWDAGLNS